MKKILIVSIIVIALVSSVVVYSIKIRGDYRTFFFEKIDENGLFVEKRFVPKSNHADKITFYVEELLLGPVTPRYKPIFPRGTKLVSCFKRDKTLYVNLSKDILKFDEAASKYQDAAEIFKKNIFKNFRNIDIIHIYVEGNPAYEENPVNQI